MEYGRSKRERHGIEANSEKMVILEQTHFSGFFLFLEIGFHYAVRLAFKSLFSSGGGLALTTILLPQPPK